VNISNMPVALTAHDTACGRFVSYHLTEDLADSVAAWVVCRRPQEPTLPSR
jgi:hypothetical protein